MGELDLVVTVVNWNVRDLLIACLDSVYAALEAVGLQGQVWVVDNASQDGSVEAIRGRFAGVQRRDLCLIPSPANLWFGGGQNLALWLIGFKSVQLPSPVKVEGSQLSIEGAMQGVLHIPVPEAQRLPRYVLILNPDTFVCDRSLGDMVRFMEEHPQAGVCGPQLVYGDDRFQHSAYRFPSLAQAFLDFWPINWRLAESALNGRYPRSLYARGEPFPVDHPLGAAMLFRREAIEQTGGFDLHYRMYVEEIDWCWRVRQSGWVIYCVPGARIIHYEGQSTRQVRPEMVVALWRSRYLFYEKHYSSLYSWAMRRVVRAGMRIQIRRTQEALGRGQIEDSTAQALVHAYREVLAM